MADISFEVSDEISGQRAPLEDIPDTMTIHDLLEALEANGPFGPFSGLTGERVIVVDGNPHAWDLELQKKSLADIGVCHSSHVKIGSWSTMCGPPALRLGPASVDFFVTGQYSFPSYKLLGVPLEMSILDLLRKLEDEGFRPFNKQGKAIGVKVGDKIYKGDGLATMQVQALHLIGKSLGEVTILEPLRFLVPTQ